MDIHHTPEHGKRYRNTVTGEVAECLRCVGSLEEFSFYMLPVGARRERDNVVTWLQSEMEPAD